MPHEPGHISMTDRRAQADLIPIEPAMLDFLTRSGIDTTGINTVGQGRDALEAARAGAKPDPIQRAAGYPSRQSMSIIPMPPGFPNVPGGFTEGLYGIGRSTPKPTGEGAGPFTGEPYTYEDMFASSGGMDGDLGVTQPVSVSGTEMDTSNRAFQIIHGTSRDEPFFIQTIDVNALLQSGSRGTLLFKDQSRVNRIIYDLNERAEDKEGEANVFLGQAATARQAAGLATAQGEVDEAAKLEIQARDLEAQAVAPQIEAADLRSDATTIGEFLQMAVGQQAEFKDVQAGQKLQESFATILDQLFPQQDVDISAFSALPSGMQTNVLSILFQTREARLIRNQTDTEQEAALVFLQQLFPGMDINESIFDIPVGILGFLQGRQQQGGQQLLTTGFTR
jgi:hypothetical protein